MEPLQPHPVLSSHPITRRIALPFTREGPLEISPRKTGTFSDGNPKDQSLRPRRGWREASMQGRESLLLVALESWASALASTSKSYLICWLLLYLLRGFLENVILGVTCEKIDAR